MAKEIERKFLVDGGDWRMQASPASTISQFYLATTEDRSVRVRIVDSDSARLTLKFGGAVRVRDEFEYAVPLEEARDMERFAVGQVIEKMRYRVAHRGRTFEVDLFKRALSGLVVAELETAEDVPDAELPDWIGREITDEPGFYNVSLAFNGMPERPR